jgi:sugar O-acyltransferase (sialic acid O-acetyltransferase NeuD family)
MSKKIIVFGDSIIAEMLYADSRKIKDNFEIAAFCVDEQYLKTDTFCDKPMLGFKEAVKLYPPAEYDMISTVDAPLKLRNRLIVFNRLKEAGYTLRNYISPLAEVCPDVVMGENNIIFQFAYIGSRVCIGDANYIRQNTYLGHDTVLGNGNSLVAGCVCGGHCNVGNSCFLGINSAVIHGIKISDETIIGAGCVVIKDIEAHSVYVGNPARLVSIREETGVML